MLMSIAIIFIVYIPEIGLSKEWVDDQLDVEDIWDVKEPGIIEK